MKNLDSFLLKMVHLQFGEGVATAVLERVKTVDIVILFDESGAELRFRYGEDNNFIFSIEKLESRIETCWIPTLRTLEFRILCH